jgi:protein TonB
MIVNVNITFTPSLAAPQFFDVPASRRRNLPWDGNLAVGFGVSLAMLACAWAWASAIAERQRPTVERPSRAVAVSTVHEQVVMPPPPPPVYQLPPRAEPPPSPAKAAPRAAMSKKAAAPVATRPPQVQTLPAPAADSGVAVEVAPPAPAQAQPAIAAHDQQVAGISGAVDAAGAAPASGASGEGAALGLEAVDAAPVAVVQAPPEYPLWALRDGASARLRLDYVVDRDGRVRDLVVTCRKGACALAQAVEPAVRKWRFRPGQKGGVAVATRVQQDVDFAIEGGDE